MSVLASWAGGFRDWEIAGGGWSWLAPMKGGRRMSGRVFHRGRKAVRAGDEIRALILNHRFLALVFPFAQT